MPTAPSKPVRHTPKSPGVLSTVAKAFKRKRGERSPEVAGSSSSMVPPIILPPSKKPTPPVSDQRSTPGSSSFVESWSSSSVRNVGPFPERQMPYMSMGPPPSRTPSVMSSASGFGFSSDPSFQVQMLQRQLQSLQEDLRAAQDTVSFQAAQLRVQGEQIQQMQLRRDEERRQYELRLAELERNQRSPRG